MPETAMMLTRETTAGHDVAHASNVLGRGEARLYPAPPVGGLASGRPIFVLLHPSAAIAALGRDTRPIS